jgi:hypothetical protein
MKILVVDPPNGTTTDYPWNADTQKFFELDADDIELGTHLRTKNDHQTRADLLV